MKKVSLKQIVIGGGLVVLGLILGRILFPGSEAIQHEDHAHQTQAEVWTCSMHPQIRESGPGKCPLCGMDLIPVESGDHLPPDRIQMTESALKLAQVQTIVVGRSIPQKEIYLPGKVEADERNIAKVTAHFDGRVERLYADFTGQYIKRGQRLATLYSPDLVTAQKELFEALKFKSTNPSFYEAAVQKLKLWELTNSQIQHIMDVGEPQYNFNVIATRSGTILTREISEGEHVMDGQVLFEIADLNQLWIMFDAYESDLPWIKVGDSIKFNLQALPGQPFQSVVSFIDPVVNKETRTASVRTEVVNKDQRLKPEMFVEGIINAGLGAEGETILIPKTAVLWTGKRAIVYVKLPGYEQPVFEFREIELGTDAGDHYVVNQGLNAGEEIVANGVFKIDGAAQLQGKTSMMNPGGGKTSTGHQHGNLSMPPEQSAAAPTQDGFQVSGLFKNQLRQVFEAYLPLKQSLVQSDVESARKNARILLTTTNKVDMKLVQGVAHQQWMKDLDSLTAAL
ncbi:MAG: efflux RND transporter periplasmic adaptor subunit, partial [Cyclobacteriaceae bacterium]|nr:efflux RND transporter periplasmic adaptor subunit [Cyclobacteriaceae bacterium]